MLAKLNVRYVIVGHSERRQLFGEDDNVVRAKVDAVLRHAMSPILCVGETLEEREAGQAESKVATQLTFALEDRGPEALESIVVAYEPMWAIGTGLTATADDAQAMAATIRGELERLGGEVVARHARPVRRLGHARQRRRSPGLPGRRRASRRRREPRPRQARLDRKLASLTSRAARSGSHSGWRNGVSDTEGSSSRW